MIILLGEEFPLALYLLWCCIFLIIPIAFGAHQLLRVDQISPKQNICLTLLTAPCLLPAPKHKAQPKPHAACPLISQKTVTGGFGRIKKEESLAKPNSFPCIPACQQRDGCKCGAWAAREVNPAGVCVQLSCKSNVCSDNAELMQFMGCQRWVLGLRCKFNKWRGRKYIHTYIYICTYICTFFLASTLAYLKPVKKNKIPKFLLDFGWSRDSIFSLSLLKHHTPLWELHLYAHHIQSDWLLLYLWTDPIRYPYACKWGSQSCALCAEEEELKSSSSWNLLRWQSHPAKHNKTFPIPQPCSPALRFSLCHTCQENAL